MSKIKVAGFDPSMRNWGICIANVDVETLTYDVENLILLETESEKKLGVRKDSDDLRCSIELWQGLKLALEGVQMIISEVPFFNPAGYPAANYGAGFVVAMLGMLPLRTIQVFPADVKLYAVGNRKAEKEEMIAWATEKFPAAPWKTVKRAGKVALTKKNEHLADAVAVVNAGLYTDQFQQATALLRGRAA